MAKVHFTGKKKRMEYKGKQSDLAVPLSLILYIGFKESWLKVAEQFGNPCIGDRLGKAHLF